MNLHHPLLMCSYVKIRAQNQRNQVSCMSVTSLTVSDKWRNFTVLLYEKLIESLYLLRSIYWGKTKVTVYLAACLVKKGLNPQLSYSVLVCVQAGLAHSTTRIQFYSHIHTVCLFCCLRYIQSKKSILPSEILVTFIVTEYG